MRILTIAAVALMTAPLPVGACTVGNVCADVAATLIGTVLADGFAPAPSVELDWSTSGEPQAPRAPLGPSSASSAAVESYRVSRCSTANRCEWIATVRAVGLCAAEQPYTVVDHTPEPAPLYRLEVLAPGGRVACRIYAVPGAIATSHTY